MVHIVSVLGALLILAAYAANQLALIDRRHRIYHAMNLAGAAILTVIALEAQQWGFVLLEGTWALLAIPPLIRPPRGV